MEIMPEKKEDTLPPGAQPLTPPAEAAATPSSETEKIEIAGQTFNSEKEALDWANKYYAQSEADKLAADAYRLGLQDAQSFQAPVTQAAPPPPEDTQWEEKFYTNPKAALDEHAKAVAERTEREIMNKLAQQQTDEKLWQEFFTLHPDLDGFKSDVQFTLDSNNEAIKVLMASKGKTEAMNYLAQKTRAKFQAYIERSKPSRVLPNTSSSATPGTQQAVTAPTKVEPPLDFVAQLRNMKKSRMKF